MALYDYMPSDYDLMIMRQEQIEEEKRKLQEEQDKRDARQRELEYMNSHYVSDILNFDAIDALNNEEDYLIKGRTNSGKTHWVKNELVPYCILNNKKLLILSHLTTLREQTRRDVKKGLEDNLLSGFDTDLVTITTYQKMVSDKNMYSVVRDNTKYQEYDLDYYDYVVLDEAHFLTSGAWTNITVDFLDILEESEKAIRIFMTATSQTLEEVLGYELKVLYENYSDNEVVDTIEKTDNIKTMHNEIIQNSNNKSLVFNRRIEEAINLHNSTQNSSFLCSANNKDYKKFRNEAEYKNIINNKKFESAVLYTTKFLEAGIDLCDKKINLICINGLFNKLEIQQQIGRVRKVDGADNKARVIIVEPSKRQLSKIISRLEFEEILYEEYKEWGIKEILECRINKFMNPSYIYVDNDGLAKVDETKAIQVIHDLRWYKHIREVGYAEAIAELFNVYEITDLDMEQLENDLVSQFLSKKMFKKYNEEVENYIGEEYSLQDDFKALLKNVYGLSTAGKSTIGLDTINGYFKDNNVSYEVVAEKQKVRINGKQKMLTYWVLVEII